MLIEFRQYDSWTFLSPRESFWGLRENVLVIGEIREEQERISIERGDHLAILGKVELENYGGRYLSFLDGLNKIFNSSVINVKSIV